jgi:hypothetical protein
MNVIANTPCRTPGKWILDAKRRIDSPHKIRYSLNISKTCLRGF